MPTVKKRAARRGPDRAHDHDRGAEGARTRILDSAYALFSRHGINAVGIDRIIAEAPVAKATLYHHFASKEDLACAFLDLRQRRWTVEWLQAEAERRAVTGAGRVLAVFEALDEWFNRADYEGCAFIRTLLEVSDRNDPIRQRAVRHLEDIRTMMAGYAEQAGLKNAVSVGHQLQLLMMGAIVAASFGDSQAARRAQPLAERVLNSSQ
jgi:AcrR family transcriptional regulator